MEYGQDMWPLFLIEKGTFVIIRDGSGNDISFNSFEECLLYTEIDFSGKTYVDYEPDRNIHIDNASGITKFTERVVEYDNLISIIPKLIEKKNDIFFNKTLLQAKELKIESVKTEASSIIYTKWPQHKQDNIALGLYPELKDQLISDINTIITECDNLELTINGLGTVEEIKNLTISFSSI